MQRVDTVFYVKKYRKAEKIVYNWKKKIQQGTNQWNLRVKKKQL